MGTASIAIFYFDKPTIGYCRECDDFAFWTEGKGLHCPTDASHTLSIFEWNGNDPHPEAEVT